MSTHLHNIRFPISARIQRIKSMVDLRKTRRSQVFRSHRLRHFFASDDHIRHKFNTICQHLDLVGCSSYSDEQKLTVLLLIMVGGDMPQIADFIRYELANELMRHLNNELNVLISGICSIVAEINSNDDNHHHCDADDAAAAAAAVNYYHHTEAGQSIGARFESDNLTFRLNINSISDLMIELLSLLLQSFGHRCQHSKRAITITTNLLRIFELCYKRMGHNQCDVIEQNLHAAILALTANGVGRLNRTKALVEYKPLMQCLLDRMSNGNGNESLMTLQILSNLANGFPENIELLIRYNLLGHLRNHLIHANCHTSTTSTHAIAEQCLGILDNICGNHRNDIQAVIDANLIAPIMNVFKSRDIYIGLQKLALNIFVSISTLGNAQQIKVLLDTDLIPLLCGQLHTRNHNNYNDTILETVLEIITNILQEFYRKDHCNFHQMCSALDEYGGFMAINQMICHSSESISNAALQLNQYNGNAMCAKFNQLSVDSISISMEQMQQ